MQVWAVQKGECIFCAFRSIAYRPKQFSTTPSTNRNRLEERARKSGDTSLWGKRASRHPKNDSTDLWKIRRPDAQVISYERPRTGAKKTPIFRSVRPPLDHLVGERLAIAKRLLFNSPDADQTDVAPSELNVDEASWAAFEETLKLLLTQAQNRQAIRWTPRSKVLFKKLKQASELEERWSAALIRTIQHAYLDHLVDSEGPGNQRGLPVFADIRYPTEWYSTARATQREIHLHVGPTNSGKTYNALKRLEEAGNGFYAGPLRLLAHEVFARFKAKGISCDLVTGDDIRRDESKDVKIYSSTVEMVEISKKVEVAVIDEIQMIAHDERGWAWTRAFLGANANEVHLCGENRVIPLIRELTASMGDTLHIHEYDRLSPLKAMSRSLRGNLKNLRKGDCVVSFSIVGIHALKKQIELDTGRRVAVVYGSLPPETRTSQAALFNDPENDYDFLVASDAIGMGLNLAIKRIIFETVMRYDGTKYIPLETPHLKQIAGRAGRFRTSHQAITQEVSQDSDPLKARTTEYHATANVGLVTCLDEKDLPVIQAALDADPEPIKTAGLLPPAQFAEEYAAHLPKGIPFEYLVERIANEAVLHPRYKLCNMKDLLGLAPILEREKSLTLAQRFVFGAAPVDWKDPEVGQPLVQALAHAVAHQKSVTVADLVEIPLEILDEQMSGAKEYLRGLEKLHKALILYLWLSYRFISIFTDQEMAFHAKHLTEERINSTLLQFSANPRLRKRLLEMKDVGAPSPGGTEESLTIEGDGQALGDCRALQIDWARGSELIESTTLKEEDGQPAPPLTTSG